MTKIFLVEDDLNFGAVMQSYLEMNEFTVNWIDSGRNAVDEFMKTKDYDLCILDVMLPYVDGFTIGESIKKECPNVPIIFLTAKTMKEDMIKGFALGADDYVTKPFDSEVLIYKIKAILNRNSAVQSAVNTEPIIKFGQFTFDYKQRLLKHGAQQEQKLSPKEADLLLHLVNNKNKVLDRNFTLNKIWGEDGYFTARSMDVYITKLRKYLKADDSLSIINIHGSGYMLKCDEV